MGSKHPNGPIRLFPSPDRIPKEQTSVPLSILDATCARFSDTGAVWLFDAPYSSSNSAALSSDFDKQQVAAHRLRSSFVTTLDDFPQWAGQLHWAAFRASGDHTERFQRCMLIYGGHGSDSVGPGVEWSVVRRDYTVDSIVPPAEKKGLAWWDNDAFPQGDLVSPAKLALADLKDYEGLPCMAVQITLFACGSYGVGVRLAHPVADAQSMMVFMHKWAANCRSAQHENLSPSLSPFGEPVFDPMQLDARATGDIDSLGGSDPELCAKARALPLHRFSWWDTDAPGYSPYLVDKTRNNIPPPDIMAESATKLSPSTTAPWHTWDLDRPAASAVLHFTGDELSRLRERARTEKTGEEGDSNISRSDALLAHLFRLIIQARCSVKATSSYQAPAADEEVFLNFTLEARRRVEPPLPETFLGSPLFMTHIKASASTILFPSFAQSQGQGQMNDSTATTGALARNLRQTLRKFTPDAVAALLHDAAFEVAPQRLWLGFLGPRHVLVTSWLRTRLYDVDFFGAASVGEKTKAPQRRPRYVHAVMGKADGIVVLLDPVVEDDGGVDVAVYLDAEVMGELKELVKRMGI